MSCLKQRAWRGAPSVTEETTNVRRNPEEVPEEHHGEIPGWLYALGIGLVLWSMYYLIANLQPPV